MRTPQGTLQLLFMVLKWKFEISIPRYENYEISNTNPHSRHFLSRNSKDTFRSKTVQPNSQFLIAICGKVKQSGIGRGVFKYSQKM